MISELREIREGLREEVMIGSRTVRVRGLSFANIAALKERFPGEAAVLGGQGDPGPGLIAAVIAAGFGAFGEPEAEADVGLLPFGVQLMLWTAVWKASEPPLKAAAVPEADAPTAAADAPQTKASRRPSKRSLPSGIRHL